MKMNREGITIIALGVLIILFIVWVRIESNKIENEVYR
jgi:hypothetical protein